MGEQRPPIYWRNILWILILLAFAGCEEASLEHSANFVAIFGDFTHPQTDRSVFRGVRFGQSVNEVQSTQSLTPRYKDDFGLVYETRGEENTEISISFLQNPQLKAGIESILVTVEVASELISIQLYREIEQFLNQWYGVPEGVQGDYSWESESFGVRIYLTLSEEKKTITLNYLPLLSVTERNGI